MSRDARRKEKQRLKRKQKQQQARKAASLTPLDRIAKSGGRLECYVNDDWRESGMASVQVLGQAPDGRYAHAAFLMDVWCVGLKDAFGHRTITRGEFDEHLSRLGQMLDMVRIPVEEAKRLVAGGIRFARQNGFKLPPHYDRWLPILGDFGDVGAADLRDFGVGGGLRYVGEEDFLRRRLAGCTVEEFLARPDVEWVTADGMPHELVDALQYLDDKEDEDAAEEEDLDVGGLDLSGAPALAELARVLDDTRDRAERAVHDWCRRTGRAPHPRLRDALNALLASVLPVVAYDHAAREDPEMADASELPDPDEMLQINLEMYREPQRREVEEAMLQVKQFMGEFRSPAAMLESLGPPADSGGGAGAAHA